jgi:TrmH family RNA methyltransferase
MEKITSKKNKLIKSAKKLISEKKYRDETNLFVCESIRVVKTLIKNGFKYRNIIISDTSKYVNDFKENENVALVPEQLFSSISLLANNDGVLAIFNKEKNNFDYLPNKKYIILDKIQNPGNLGTIIRTCVAFEIDGIIITNDSVDLYHPNIIRSSMGSVFSLPIKVSTNLSDVIKTLKDKEYTIYGTAINKAAIKISSVKFEIASAIVFGNEGNGINQKDLMLCDKVIYIPISEKVDSLNIAVAAGIIINKLV